MVDHLTRFDEVTSQQRWTIKIGVNILKDESGAFSRDEIVMDKMKLEENSKFRGICS